MTLGIIQARFASTRLPGKVLMNVGGYPLIDLVMARCRKSTLVEKWIVATTWEDKELANYLFTMGTEVFQGPTNNVLKRFRMCAQSEHLDGHDMVVRITADDPFKDATLIDRMIQELILDSGLDYCSNTNPQTYPIGLDVEAFRYEALKEADDNCIFKHWREHVTPFIYEQPEIFKLKNVWNDKDLSHIRLTIDTPEDLQDIQNMLGARDPITVDWHEIIG